MKTYLLRTKGVDNKYYPDKLDKYAFNENAPNCTRLINDIQREGIKYYLYLISTGEIVEKGTVTRYTSEDNMYYTIYEKRESLNPAIKLPKWPSPENGIIPLSEEEIKEIEENGEKKNRLY